MRALVFATLAVLLVTACTSGPTVGEPDRERGQVAQEKDTKRPTPISYKDLPPIASRSKRYATLGDLRREVEKTGVEFARCRRLSGPVHPWLRCLTTKPTSLLGLVVYPSRREMRAQFKKGSGSGRSEGGSQGGQSGGSSGAPNYQLRGNAWLIFAPIDGLTLVALQQDLGGRFIDPYQ